MDKKQLVINPDDIKIELKKILVDQNVNLPKNLQDKSVIVIQQNVNFYSEQRVDSINLDNIISVFDELFSHLNTDNRLDELMSLAILYSLYKSNGVAKDASLFLGISQRAMSYQLSKLGLNKKPSSERMNALMKFKEA